MKALKVENLTKTYKKKNVLDSLFFNVEENTTSVILGLDNSGKTTLAKTLALVLKPNSGIISYFDEENKLGEYNDDVSLMPSELGLSEHLTVFENLLLMAQTRHIGAKGAKELVLEYMKKYELIDRLDDKVIVLSHSLKKIVSFVLTLISDTKVIILDEPFKDVDVKYRRKLLEYIKEIKKIKTIIITTELPEIALELGDDIYILEDGKLNEVDKNIEVKDLENLLLNAEVK